MHLAQELVDTIIDNTDGGVKLWKTCSLVCRAWLPAPRRHLFSHVELKRLGSNKHGGRAERSRQFLQLLDTESCTFAPFVTRLSVDGIATKAAEHPRVFRILAKLTAVRSLQFNVWRFGFGIDLEPIQNWLPRLGSLSELTLNRVSFESMTLLFSVLECCSSLIALNIMMASFEDPFGYFKHIKLTASGPIIELPSKAPPFPYTHSSSIQQLHLDCSKREFLDDFTATASSFNCRTVHFENIKANETQSIGAFFQRLGTTLEHLKLGFSFSLDAYGEAFADNVDLRYNTGLRSIHVTEIIDSHDLMGSCHLARLPSILRQCASPHLTDIIFSIYLEALPHLSIFNWAALDEALMSIQVQLDSPGKVTFYLVDLPLVHNEGDVAELLAEIQSWLPQSSAQFTMRILPGGRNPRPLIGGENYE
ncbi:hypothetical protein C8R44DRAFT_822712 [Mycena epipterygia]|nr:hypothetical protein C8R44DRAFT_822712 [Mycena epipterygia]